MIGPSFLNKSLYTAFAVNVRLELLCLFTNIVLTANVIIQGYRYKIRKEFSKFYHSYLELIVKYNIVLNTLLQKGISKPLFHCDLVYKFKRTFGNPILVINSNILSNAIIKS